jgi:hypothetical protein
MRGRAATVIVMATGLLLGACGAGSEAVTTIATTTTSSATSPTTVRSELVPGSTAACDADDPWGSVETVFEGTISSVEVRPNSDRDGLFLELGEEPPDEGWPWVTFEVSRWYTRDFGTTFAMWAPGFTGTAGETWLVAGSLYGAFGVQSGEVFPCVTVPSGPEAEAVLVERYGEPVTAGSGEPEETPNPALVDRLEEQRALWEASGIDDYTAVINVYVGNQQEIDDTCGHNTSIRVVVEDGAPVQAIDLQRFCEVDLGNLALIDDLFDLALANAGAISEPINFDQQYGFVRYFYATDRSVEAGVSVEMFQPRPVRGVVGSEGSMTAASEARDRWEQAGIDDYSFDLDVVCFCTIGGRFHVVVEDGVPVSVTQQGDAIDPGQYDFIEFTVDGLFELAETWGGGLEPDQMVAAFDPELGYPMDLRIDAISEAVDDEVTVVVHDFNHGSVT